MQTLRPSKAPPETRTAAPQRRTAPRLDTVIIAGALLAVWGWFVNALGEIDVDTIFLAVFCTVLSLFILKAFTSGFKDEPSSF